eukprot:5296709-Pleurochrysis_carterae.AAC.2
MHHAQLDSLFCTIAPRYALIAPRYALVNLARCEPSRLTFPSRYQGAATIRSAGGSRLLQALRETHSQADGSRIEYATPSSQAQASRTSPERRALNKGRLRKTGPWELTTALATIASRVT